eukprot:7315236-Prymnesium_polylepis.1
MTLGRASVPRLRQHSHHPVRGASACAGWCLPSAQNRPCGGESARAYRIGRPSPPRVENRAPHKPI